jgi:hypothetical protein
MTIQPGGSVFIVDLPPALVASTPETIIRRRKVLRFDDFADRCFVDTADGTPLWYAALDCYPSFAEAKGEAMRRLDVRRKELARLAENIDAMPEPPVPDY